HGQNGRRQGIRRNVEKDQIDVRPAKRVARRRGLLGAVDHPEIDDLDACPPQALGDLPGIVIELVLQTFELTPISLKSNGEQSNAQFGAVVRGILWQMESRGS